MNDLNNAAPTPTPEKKRFILLGRINVHVTAIEVQQDLGVAEAVETYNRWVQTQDPKLAELTETQQVVWCEVPETSVAARDATLARFLSIMQRITPEGKIPPPPKPQPVVLDSPIILPRNFRRQP